MDPIIEVRDLTKDYQVRERQGLFRSSRRTIHALKGVTLSIQPGEFFGLLGPNGAGKTTLIKCMTTLMLPTGGTVKVKGYDVEREEAKVRASIGCMLMGERGLYNKLTGRENLDYFASLYFLPRSERRQRINAVIDRLKLHDFADRPIESYSSGQRMKLSFAKTLINDAPILVFDEPSNTLDVHSAREMQAIVKELNAEGRTIIYTTHLMAEAEMLCDRVAIIDHGQAIALGTLDELKSKIPQEGVVRVRGVFGNEVLSMLQKSSMVDKATITTSNGSQELVIVASQPSGVLPDIIRVLSESNTIIEDIVPSRITLEDVFVAMTGRALVEDTAVR